MSRGRQADRTTSEVQAVGAEERILDAARALFLSDGFSGVSTDQLSRTAGVSKSSIYKYFGDMGGVLSAVVRREGDLFSIGVTSDPATPDAFWRALTTYGTNLLTLLNEAFCIQMDRVMHEEARRHPDLMRRFYDSAYGRGHQEIGDLIAIGKTRGYITKSQSAADLADNLLSMWSGLGCVRSRLGLQEQPREKPKVWARQCVRALFGEDIARQSKRSLAVRARR